MYAVLLESASGFAAILPAERLGSPRQQKYSHPLRKPLRVLLVLRHAEVLHAVERREHFDRLKYTADWRD